MTNQQPVALNVAIGGVLSTGVSLAALVFGLDPLLQVAIIAFGNSVIIVAVIILTQRLVTPINNATLAEGTSVKVEGSEDSVIIAKSPPGPTGIEGGAG